VDAWNYTVRLRAFETCDARCRAGQPLRGDQYPPTEAEK